MLFVLSCASSTGKNFNQKFNFSTPKQLTQEYGPQKAVDANPYAMVDDGKDTADSSTPILLKDDDEGILVEKPATEKSKSVLLPSLNSSSKKKYLAKHSKQPSTVKKEEEIALNFDDVDIYEITHTVFKDILKVNYMIDPRIKGRITFMTTKPIAKSDVLPVISTIFRVNAVTILEENDIYRIVPTSEITKEPVDINFGRSSEEVRLTGLSRIQIVPINFIPVSDMITILKPFLTQNATITEIPGKNFIMIADVDENIKRILAIVEAFDDNVFEDVRVELFVFKNLDVEDAVGDLQQTLPLFSMTTRESLKVKYLAIDRLNALLVVTPNEEYMDHIRAWIKVVDNIFEDARPKVYVYPLQNSKADHVVEILNQILSGSSSGSKKSSSKKKTSSKSSSKKSSPNKSSSTKQPTSLPTANVSASDFVSSATKFYYDDVNNTIIILALPKDYLFIKEMIAKIDVIPRQVLIEAMVVEVTLDDSLSYGVQWFLDTNFKLWDNNKYSGYVTSSPVGGGSFSTENPFNSAGLSIALLDSSEQLRAMLQALATTTALNVISTPHVLVSDNQEAKINVGTQVPIIKSSTPVEGTNSPQTIYEYKDTGVTLRVKPQINKSGLVTLEIFQEVSDVQQSSGSTAENPPIYTRNAETKMVVQDGKSIVIAGLIKNKMDTSNSGVPLLKDIPVLGHLFQYNARVKSRTELLIIITPHVVHSRQDADRLTSEFINRLEGLHELLGYEKDKESKREFIKEPNEKAIDRTLKELSHSPVGK